MRYFLVLLMFICVNPAWALEISSEDFGDGDVMRPHNTCAGDDVSPDLNWKEVDRDDNFILLEKNHYTTSWQRPAPDHLTAPVTLSSPTQVVASESWYPGWQVTVDYKPASLVRANSAFLGVNVPIGQHQINFHCRQPWYYLIGKLISLTAVAIVIYVQKTPRS